MNHRRMVGRRGCRIRRSRDDIARLLEEYRSSGLTQVAYARWKGICLSTLTNWLRRSRIPGSRWEVDRPRLVPVEITDGPSRWIPGVQDGFEVTFPGGLRLAIPPRFDEKALERLLALLAGAC